MSEIFGEIAKKEHNNIEEMHNHKQVRCPRCNKLLVDKLIGKVQMRCIRCKTNFTFDTKQN